MKPRASSQNDLDKACSRTVLYESPRAVLFAKEKGIATPTMNMKKGWIRSQANSPFHSACSNCLLSSAITDPPIPLWASS